MKLLWEGLLTLLSALGVALLGGLLFGRLVRPLPGPGLWVLVPGRGGGEQLERDLRGLAWLRGLGLLRGCVVIVDCGLDPEGRELALHLTRRWPEVALCSAGAVNKLIHT